MKKQNFLLIVGLTVVSFGAFLTPAKALIYNADDLMLGFYATGGTGAGEGLLVNIGQASVYRDAAVGSFFDLNIGNIGADLVAVFGEDWNIRVDVKWGVFGGTFNQAVGSDPIHTLYAVKSRGNVNTPANPYSRAGVAPQSGTSTKFKDQGTFYAQGTVATSNSSVATIQPVGQTNGFASFQKNSGQESYSYFQGALGSFTNGTAGSVLDLFRMQTGSGSGSHEGTFTINNAGVVRFTAVPEPTTWALLVLAAGTVGLAIRSRANRA